MYTIHTTIALCKIAGGVVVCGPILIILDGPIFLKAIATILMCMSGVVTLLSSIFKPIKRPFSPPLNEVAVASIFAGTSLYGVAIVSLIAYYGALAVASLFDIDHFTVASFAAFSTMTLSFFAVISPGTSNVLRMAYERFFAVRTSYIYVYITSLALLLALSSASLVFDLV